MTGRYINFYLAECFETESGTSKFKAEKSLTAEKSLIVTWGNFFRATRSLADSLPYWWWWMGIPKGTEQERENEKRLDAADLVVCLAEENLGIVGDLPIPSSSSLGSWSSSELLE